jgi:RNA polymerase sigma factor (TIGR02999 family)
MAADPPRVTELLVEWRRGDRSALDRLMPLVYAELRRLAGAYLKSERSGHTLEPTALVHEAYARLVDADVPWRDRVHFFAVAARTMRRILVDHARARQRAKRGGELIRVPLDEERAGTGPELDILALDEALGQLRELDERKHRLVELRYFAGLTNKECAEVVGVSPATVKRELRTAKAWLSAEMRATGG